MRKLLNTLYITDADTYLSLDGENLVCLKDGTETFRIPFTNIESIFCFSFLGCSPALMGKCAKENVALSFLTPYGRFLARVTGEVKGNVFLRKQQLEKFGEPEEKLRLIRNTIAAKLSNTRALVKRTMRDYPETDADGKLSGYSERLKENIERLYAESDEEVLRGIEGNSAKGYFEIFDRLILKQKEDFKIYSRLKRPPLDRVNAVLSFLYTLYTLDFASALESVGLDAYIGFFHTLRPGRASLACDMVEETRAVVERLTLTMINLKVLQAEDFDVQEAGAVLLNDKGRKKVLIQWQEKKSAEFRHPVLKEKIKWGLLPFVQASLMAKYVRGEIDEYPPFLLN